VKAISFTRRANIRRIIFRCRSPFATTTRRACWPSRSREFRLDRDISSQLPKVAVISPSSGGIPVGFGVREALNAEQIYWAEREDNGKRMFRQYVNQGEVNPCIIVDDIIRSGSAIEETVGLVKELGAKIIGCGSIVRFTSAPDNINGVPIKALIDFDAKIYETGDQCADCKESVPEEHVRF
jgi:orotate phosphoribosyltransferase